MSQLLVIKSLRDRLFVNSFVVEVSEGRPDVVLLAHLEVLAEVLVAAPPVSVDHAHALVPSNLVEVGVAEVIFVSVVGHGLVVYPLVPSVKLTRLVVVHLHHRILLVLANGGDQPALEQAVSEVHVHESDSLISVEDVHLPVPVAHRVLPQSRDVSYGSPLLRFISWLLH